MSDALLPSYFPTLRGSLMGVRHQYKFELFSTSYAENFKREGIALRNSHHHRHYFFFIYTLPYDMCALLALRFSYFPFFLIYVILHY